VAIRAGSQVDLIKPLSTRYNALQIYLRAMKKTMDVDRRPGRFLLTGSANVLTLPHVSESLERI
jgi:hypothetical protein